MANWYTVSVFRKYNIFECNLGDSINLLDFALYKGSSYKNPKFIVSILSLRINRDMRDSTIYDFNVVKTGEQIYRVGNVTSSLGSTAKVRVLVYEGDYIEV